MLLPLEVMRGTAEVIVTSDRYIRFNARLIDTI